MIYCSPEANPRPRIRVSGWPDLPDHFSFSSMQQFHGCPRKWFYSYLLKAPRERQPSTLLFGAALHEALAYLHLSVKQGHAPDLATLDGAFRSQWSRMAVETEICYGKTETREELFRIARELLRLALEASPEKVRILAIERPVKLKLPGLTVDVVGRVDLIVEEEGVIWVVDLKTSRNTLSADQIAQGGAQLALYTAALQAEGVQELIPSRARLQVLRKIKKPKLEAVEVDIGAASLERAKRMLGDTWRLIESAASSGAFPTKPGWGCSSCPFRDRCQKDTSGVGSAPYETALISPSAVEVPVAGPRSGILSFVSALARLFSR